MGPSGPHKVLQTFATGKTESRRRAIVMDSGRNLSQTWTQDFFNIKKNLFMWFFTPRQWYNVKF